mmetsp:Transcript_2630/g.7576  ORF Transcript_2630/g.7576 Transcript_2630/m.7576 type:complete len:246 (-) Transcript_2630:49-786(-)
MYDVKAVIAMSPRSFPSRTSSDTGCPCPRCSSSSRDWVSCTRPVACKQQFDNSNRSTDPPGRASIWVKRAYHGVSFLRRLRSANSSSSCANLDVDTAMPSSAFRRLPAAMAKSFSFAESRLACSWNFLSRSRASRSAMRSKMRCSRSVPLLRSLWQSRRLQAPAGNLAQKPSTWSASSRSISHPSIAASTPCQPSALEPASSRNRQTCSFVAADGSCNTRPASCNSNGSSPADRSSSAGAIFSAP